MALLLRSLLMSLVAFDLLGGNGAAPGGKLWAVPGRKLGAAPGGRFGAAGEALRLTGDLPLFLVGDAVEFIALVFMFIWKKKIF